MSVGGKRYCVKRRRREIVMWGGARSFLFYECLCKIEKYSIFCIKIGFVYAHRGIWSIYH